MDTIITYILNNLNHILVTELSNAKYMTTTIDGLYDTNLQTEQNNTLDPTTNEDSPNNEDHTTLQDTHLPIDDDTTIHDYAVNINQPTNYDNTLYQDSNSDLDSNNELNLNDDTKCNLREIKTSTTTNLFTSTNNEFTNDSNENYLKKINILFLNITIFNLNIATNLFIIYYVYTTIIY